MTPRQLMIRELQLQRKSDFTIKSYVFAVSQLARYFNRSPNEISRDEVRDYFHYMISVKKLATSTVNTNLAGIQFYYQRVLGQDKFDLRVPRKRTGKLPVPLARSEIRKLIESVSNQKHRMMLMTTYGGGLRVSEVVNLKVTDIHSSRMMIHIRQAKGGKDRYTILSQRLLTELRRYWLDQRPSDWLFPNPNGNALSRTCLQQVYYQAKKRAGITRGGGIHALRHSFATHLLESGVDLTIIARLLGHRHLSTTTQYLHVTTKHVRGVRSPLDLLRKPDRDELSNELPDQGESSTSSVTEEADV